MNVVRGFMMVLVLAGLSAAQQDNGKKISLDPDLKPYQPVSGISGNLSSVGSDTLNNLMALWAEKYKSYYPNVGIQIEGKGSSTAPPALINATAQLGPMSRTMKSKEIDDFEKKYGYKPTEMRVAVDSLAVFVHKDNPIKSLSLEQVDAVFSKSRRRGAKEAKTWGDLGLTGEWADKPISKFGRNSASGTYGFFKEHVLKNGDYRDDVKEQPGSASVVLGVHTDKYAIGYSGIGYATSGVRALPIAEKAGSEAFAANQQNAYSGDYPIARFLFIYVNKAPNRALEPLTREFFKLVLSKEGQEVVVKDGYFPIPASIADEERKKIE